MSRDPSRVRKKTRSDVAPCTVAEAEGSLDRIHELLRESDPAVRRGLARNPAVPQESLSVLAEDFPDDVFGNPTLQFLIASSPSALCAWPTPSLVAMAHAPHVDPALLALLLQSFTFTEGGRIEQSNRLKLLDALLANSKLPATAVTAFLSRAPALRLFGRVGAGFGELEPRGERRVRQLEDAAMHAALQPRSASVEEALNAVTTCLSLGLFRDQPSIWMVRAIQDPNRFCRAVVRGLGDSSRIAASLVTGGVQSTLFKDFFSDRSTALLEPDRTVDAAELLRAAPMNDGSPTDRHEHLEWLESPLAKKRASALLSRFATSEQLRAALQFERRTTVRAAAEEGLRRATYGCGEATLLAPHRLPEIKTIQAIVRWPEVTGRRLSKVVEAIAQATWSPIDEDSPRASQDNWRRSACLALLARHDLSEVDMETLARSDLATLVAQCAHSTRTMLRHVIRQSHSFDVRVRASWHPDADPRDVAWLRSPTGLLDSLNCDTSGRARSYGSSGEETDDAASTSTDPVEYARRTKGQKVGNIERILALALKQCPKDMLLLRAKSDCWIERLLVAAHTRTPKEVRTRLLADSCWAVAVVARDALTLNATASSAPRGTKAKAQSQRAQQAARRLSLMSDIQKKLSSPNWEVVRGCIREVIDRADKDILEAMNKGITFTTDSSRDGKKLLHVKRSDKSIFRRSVKSCFRHEAALELVRAQIGPDAPLVSAPQPRYPTAAQTHRGLIPSGYSELRKSLRDVDGLPSFEHYAGDIRLILDHCGSSWSNRAIAPVPGLERLVAVLFNQAPFRPDFLKAAHNLSVIEGHIPVLPRLPSVRSVSGMVETTPWIDSPVTFIQELTNLERLNLEIHGYVTHKGCEFTFSLQSHPQLRELCLHCLFFSRFSIRLAGNSVHPHLRSLTLARANVVVEHGMEFPNLESLTLVDCARVPESLLGCAGLQSLRVKGDLGHAQLNLVSDRLERVNISDNKDLQTVERLLPHGRLETVELDQCHSLRAVNLGRSMANLKRVSIRNCNGVAAVSLPDSCPSLEEVLIHGCAGISSAETVLGRLPSKTPLKSVGFTSCEALEDIDALARFPSIERIDLRGCPSIRSVAALKVLGPSLRLQMFGAGRAKGEADLAPGVVSRRLGET